MDGNESKGLRVKYFVDMSLTRGLRVRETSLQNGHDFNVELSVKMINKKTYDINVETEKDVMNILLLFLLLCE